MPCLLICAVLGAEIRPSECLKYYVAISTDYAFSRPVFKEYLLNCASQAIRHSQRKLSVIIFTGDALGPKLGNFERIFLEVGKKLKVEGCRKGQLTIKFCLITINDMIIAEYNGMQEILSSDQAVSGFIVHGEPSELSTSENANKVSRILKYIPLGPWL